MNCNAICLLVILAIGAPAIASFQVVESDCFVLPQECDNKPCVMKCCGSDQVLYRYHNNTNCLSITQLRKQMDLSNIYDDVTTYKGLKIRTADGATESSKNFADFYVFHGRKSLKSAAAWYQGDLLETGEFAINNETLLKPPNFCTEVLVGIGRKTLQPKAISVFYVWDEVSQDVTRSLERMKFNVIGRLISSLFLAMVLMVYILLKPLRAHCYGMLMTAYISSMIMTLIVQAAMQLMNYELMKSTCVPSADLQTNSVLCPIFYFFTITTFLLLTLMSYKIWRQFRCTKLSSASASQKKSFVKCWVTTWGVGSLMTGSLLVIDRYQPAGLPVPGFNNCLGDSSQWYIHGPIALCLFCNTVFYALTFCNTQKTRAASNKQFKNEHSKKSKKVKNMFTASFNMFVIMGASWIIDVVIAYTPPYDFPLWQYVMVHFLNVFNGVVLFVLLVAKKRIIKMLCKKYKIKNRFVMTFVDTKAVSRMEPTKWSKVQRKSTNDSVQIEVCDYFNQSDAGAHNTFRFHDTIIETDENRCDVDLSGTQRDGRSTFKPNVILCRLQDKL